MAVLFERPPPASLRVLPGIPVLDSWNAADHPDQKRLNDYLNTVDRLVAADVAGADRLALELLVGLPRSHAVTGRGRDLDNYLLPLARRIGHQRIAAAFATKRTQAQSFIAVCPAVPGAAQTDSAQLGVRTTVSAESQAWKQQVHAACGQAVREPLPAGPVAVCVMFSVSEQRNWTALWKPTLDALGPLLGVPDPDRPFHPADDRIVDLQLHRRIDGSLRHDVVLDIWWHRDIP